MLTSLALGVGGDFVEVVLAGMVKGVNEALADGIGSFEELCSFWIADRGSRSPRQA